MQRMFRAKKMHILSKKIYEMQKLDQDGKDARQGLAHYFVSSIHMDFFKQSKQTTPKASYSDLVSAEKHCKKSLPLLKDKDVLFQANDDLLTIYGQMLCWHLTNTNSTQDYIQAATDCLDKMKTILDLFPIEERMIREQLQSDTTYYDIKKAAKLCELHGLYYHCLGRHYMRLGENVLAGEVLEISVRYVQYEIELAKALGSHPSAHRWLEVCEKNIKLIQSCQHELSLEEEKPHSDHSILRLR